MITIALASVALAASGLAASTAHDTVEPVRYTETGGQVTTKTFHEMPSPDSTPNGVAITPRVQQEYLAAARDLAPALVSVEDKVLLSYPPSACRALTRGSTTYDLLSVGANTDLAANVAGSMTIAAVALYCPEHQPINNVNNY